MKPIPFFRHPRTRARLIGVILIGVGIVLLLDFLFNQRTLSAKLGFAAVFIGVFMIFMITETTIPQRISNAQLKGNLNTIRAIAKELNLTGNAVFLPRSPLRSEERVFIPLSNSQPNIPNVDDTIVFSTGLDGKSLGVALPPSGLPLVNELETDAGFTQGDMTTIEEKLQTFVGANLLKSIVFKHTDNIWVLQLEKPLFCTKDPTLCKQYPCPTCSAALVALTRAAKTPLRIQDVTSDKHKIQFHLQPGGT